MSRRMTAPVYTYYAANARVVAHPTAQGTTSNTIVRLSDHGLGAEMLRVSELDRSRDDGGNGYYTTPTKAIEAFIARGEAVLAKAGVSDGSWGTALGWARTALRDLTAAASAPVRTTPSRASYRRAAQTTPRRRSTK